MTGTGSEGNNEYEFGNFSERIDVRVGVGVGYMVTGSFTGMSGSGRSNTGI